MVGKGMAVSVGNGEGDIEGVREGGSSYVMVGVNVVVFVTSSSPLLDPQLSA